METFFQHPHLLDGALGRTAAYLAIGILLGLSLWESWLKQALKDQRYYRYCALLLGLLGGIIAINAVALDASDPFGTDTMALPDLATGLTVLRETNFGQAWLAYISFLLLGVFSSRLVIRAAAMIGMTVALVFSSHGGEAGIAQAAFWADFFHMLFALFWLGGLSVLIALRLGKRQQIHENGLRFFSRFALPVFFMILASGVLQVLLKSQMEGSLSYAYIAVLSIKLILVIAIMMSAWALRRSLKKPIDEVRFDNGLSVEYFFALVLILTTGLLTQIPPS
jgi:putative copper resistance protein D